MRWVWRHIYFLSPAVFLNAANVRTGTACQESSSDVFLLSRKKQGGLHWRACACADAEVPTLAAITHRQAHEPPEPQTTCADRSGRSQLR